MIMHYCSGLFLVFDVCIMLYLLHTVLDYGSGCPDLGI